METKRLKNIAILILLLVNAFLLFLVIYQDVQTRRVQKEAADQLYALFASEELTLSSEVDLMGRVLTPLLPVRETEMEAEIAEFLLGDTVSSQSEGGGIISYSSQHGTVQFRSGGGFDTVRFVRPVDDPKVFFESFISEFGYSDMGGEVMNGSGSYTAVKYISSVPVYGCTVTFTFEDSCLVAAAGAYVDQRNMDEDTQDSLECVSALISFFDYRREEGAICSTIESVECVYRLQNTRGVPQLCPLWVVETDTYTYLVDGLSGEVSRG